MYEIDQRDRVVALDGLPKPDAGAPLPLVAANESTLLIAYYIQGPPTQWDPAELEDPRFDDQTATVIFSALNFMFGYPNDEVLSGHPLYARGLKWYGGYEVLESSWVRRLERMNRVHDLHNPDSFLSYHHFILTFHDTMLECVASDFIVERAKESPSDAMRRNIHGLLDGRRGRVA